MEISIGMVITQIVDIDFEEKSLNLNVEFIMTWTDEFIKLNAGYGNKVRIWLQKHNLKVFPSKVQLKSIADIWSPDLYISALKQRSEKSESSSITLSPNDEGTVGVLYIFEVFNISD